MRKILLLISSFILLSCGTSQKPTGIWQLAYLTSPKGKISVPTTRTIFDFQEDSLKIIDIGNPFTGEWRKLDIMNCQTEFRNNTLVITENTKEFEFEIQTNSGDSLVLSSDSLAEKITLKRLVLTDEQKVSTANLINKSFLFRINSSYVENLDFVSDSIVLYGSNYRPMNWNIVSYQGFDFLNINFHLFGLFTLNKDEQKSIVLRGNYTRPLEYRFQLVNKSNETPDLIGSWIEYERTPNLPIFLKYDTLEQLNISNEHFEYSRFDRTWKEPWHLTNDGQAIYFQTDGNYKIQRILELTDTTLVLQQMGMDSLTVKYKKQVTSAKNP